MTRMDYLLNTSSKHPAGKQVLASRNKKQHYLGPLKFPARRVSMLHITLGA
jgi:hypothetical protein